MTTRTTRVDQINIALKELQANKQAFTEETFSMILLALMERKRALQTAKVDPNTDYDEIRLVSVMFIDVENSTELAQQIGTEEWKQAIAQAHERLSAVVAGWDGEVGQYLGDGMLCFFGAHRSHGDDAVRAVSAAMDAQLAMTVYAEKMNQQYKVEFGVRIGIATGRVVVGMVGGDAKKEFLALGPSTNLAARLQGICPTGSVTVDQQTYRRIRNYFYTRKQASVRLKGFDEPVEHYIVLERRRQRAAQFTTSRIAGIETPFVGRETELDFLNAIAEKARNEGKFQVVTLYGEVGIGKSRLLQEFAFHAASKSFVQVHMVADYDKDTVSYNLLRDLITKSCNLTQDTPPDITRKRITDYVADTWPYPEVETLAAVIGYLSGYGFEDSPHIQPLKRGGHSRERMAFSWLSRWFKGLAENSTLLMIVDNLQWADSLSLDMLEYIARDLSNESGLIIGAARPDFMKRQDYVDGLERHTAWMLNTLDEKATRELIDVILNHVERPPENLPQLIIERSEGNPLFIEEFMSMLFDSSVFESSGTGRWKVDPVAYQTAVSKLPGGLVEVIQARLDDLPAMSRHVVQVASVSGQIFWSGLISEMTTIIPTSVIEDLVTRGIVVENPETMFENEHQYQYRHPIYREVAYEMLPRAKRENYHNQVASWLSSRVAEKQDFMSVLAAHYEEGQQPQEAMRAYLSAVENRIARGLLDEALRMIDKALALAGKVPREVALPIGSQLWALRGQAYNALNRFNEASAACQSAIRLFNELPRTELTIVRILAYRMLGQAYRSLGDYTEAMEAFQDAYEHVPEDNPAELSAVLRSFGGLFLSRGRLGESLAYQQRAFNIAQDINDQVHLTGAMTQLGLIAYDRGDLATALGYFDRVLRINLGRENSHFLILDWRNIGAVYRSLFAYELALDVFDEAEELQASLGFRDPLLQANRGLCWMALGRIEEGLQSLEEAAGAQDVDAHTAFQLHLHWINGLALIGDYVRCREQAQILAEDVRHHNPILFGRALLWLGIANHTLGIPGSIETLEYALNTELEYGGLYSWLCFQALALVCNDPTVARAHYTTAANIINAIASSLHTRPDLQVILLNNTFVRAIMASAQA